MTELEKVADLWWSENRETAFSLTDAYVAGFKEARSRAANTARHVSPYNAVCCRVHGENVAANIEQLGEGEVGTEDAIQCLYCGFLLLTPSEDNFYCGSCGKHTV